MGSNEVKISSPVIADVFSIFDEQFSIADLQEAIEKNEEETNTVLSSVRRAVKKAADHADEEDETIYVVDLDESIKEAIDSGAIKLDTNKSGEIFA